MGKPKKPKPNQRDIDTFHNGGLHHVFARLPKLAQQALIDNKIKSPMDLRKWSMEDLAELPGMGSSALLTLKTIKGK